MVGTALCAFAILIDSPVGQLVDHSLPDVAQIVPNTSCAEKTNFTRHFKSQRPSQALPRK